MPVATLVKGILSLSTIVSNVEKGNAMPRVSVSPEPFQNHPTEPIYTFRLDQYRIADTRSPHEDTNVIGYTLTAGNQTYTQNLPPAHVNNGNHDICLEFPGIKIDDPTTPVTVAFAIVNSGHNSAGVLAALEKGVDVLIAHEAIGGDPVASVAMLAVDAGLALVFAECDGSVAADTLTVPRSALDATIPANGRIQTHTKHYPGTDSGDGCGGNSSYYVTQTLIRTDVGDVHQPQAAKTFIIASRSSGLVLDVPGGVSTVDVAIQQYPDNGTPAQHWNLIQAEDEYFTIRSVLSGLVLEVAGDSEADHANIQQGVETGAYNQHWTFETVSIAGPDLPFPVLPNNNSFYKIRSRLSGKVFDVPNRSADPVKIQQYTSKSSDYNNQLWQLIAIDDAPPAITTGEQPVIIERVESSVPKATTRPAKS